MDTATHPEPGEGWGASGGEASLRLESLLALVREEHRRAELSPERRAQIRERVLARIHRYEVRRRRVRALVATASTLLLAAVSLKLLLRARDLRSA